MNIIAKTGSAIARNKEAVKTILSSYNIPHGTGSTFELIKASFSAIKGGNTDLATDIAALVVTGNKNSSGKLSRKQEKVASLISTVQAIKEEFKKKKTVQNTDGDAIAATTSELINAVSVIDIDQAANTASQAANKSIMSLNIALGISLLIMVVIILGLSGYNFKKLIPKF